MLLCCTRVTSMRVVPARSCTATSLHGSMHSLTGLKKRAALKVVWVAAYDVESMHGHRGVMYIKRSPFNIPFTYPHIPFTYPQHTLKTPSTHSQTTDDIVPEVPHQPLVPRGVIRADLPTAMPVQAADYPQHQASQAAAAAEDSQHSTQPAEGSEEPAEVRHAPLDGTQEPGGAQGDVASLPSLPSLPSVPRSSSSSPSPGVPPQQREVHKAVTAFVKEVLNPLYKAGVVDKSVFKQAAAKSVSKVCVRICAAGVGWDAIMCVC